MYGQNGQHRFRQAALAVAAVVALTLTACGGTGGDASNTNSQASSIIVSNGSAPSPPREMWNNVLFYFGPEPGHSGTVFTNQVEIHDKTAKGWHSTESHVYGWATISNGAVHLTIPGGEQVLNLCADYGTARTKAYSNLSWNPATPIPLSRKLMGSDRRTYVISLTDVTAQMFNPKLPMVPCDGVHKC